MAKTTRNDIVIETDVLGVCEDFTETVKTTVLVFDPLQLKTLEFVAKNWETRFDYNKKTKNKRRNRNIRNSVEIEESIEVETKNIEKVVNNTQQGEHEQQEI